MWQSVNSKKGVKNTANELSEGVKSENPADCIDSGFLSDANIGHRSPEHHHQDHHNHHHHHHQQQHHVVGADNSSAVIGGDFGGKNNNNEGHQMRADSGIVEVGLSKTISQLTLKPVTINLLRGKVQTEPTVELAPVTTSNDCDNSQILNTLQQQEERQNLCRLYYSQDDDGDTQLHIAIVQGFHEVSLSLIRMAPHPSLFDCLNQKRQSPLHLAVLTHQSSIVRHLILAGADPSLRNSDGNTALHLAAASGDLACAQALTNPLLVTERIYLNPGRPKLQIPQDLEQRNYEGETCLHSAVVAGNTEIVRLLLSIGSDLEAKERLGGRTALHLAIESRRRGVTSLLLTECRPQLDALTYGGITPYEIASCWDSQLAKQLVKLGASTPSENGSKAPANSSSSSVANNNPDNNDLNKIPQLRQSVGLRA